MTTTDATTEITAPAIDEAALMDFVFRAVDEVGATLNCAPGRDGRPARLLPRPRRPRPDDRAEPRRAHRAPASSYAPGVAQRPGRRRLRRRTTRPPARTRCRAEHAVALTDETSPAFLPGFFQIAFGTVRDADRIIDAGPRAATVSAGTTTTPTCTTGCERFFRPGYAANLVVELAAGARRAWSPSCERGARVADIGCGHGASTILMAQAFPASTFVGSDYHGASIDDRPRAGCRGGRCRGPDQLRGRARDRVRRHRLRPGHDLRRPARHGRPGRARARHVFEALADDGTWMVVEPAAGDRDRGQPQPGRPGLLRVLHAALHAGLAVPGASGLALGTQAGPARIRDVVTAAGFTRFRIAAQTPFNNVFEVRK